MIEKFIHYGRDAREYYGLCFSNKRDYNRAIRNCRDTLGPAGPIRNDRPVWVYDQSELIIAFRLMSSLNYFLVENCGYKRITINGFHAHDVYEWAFSKGYGIDRTWDFVSFITPTEKEHLLCILKWEGQGNAPDASW